MPVTCISHKNVYKAVLVIALASLIFSWTNDFTVPHLISNVCCLSTETKETHLFGSNKRKS